MLFQPVSRFILALLILCIYLSSASALPVIQALGILEMEAGTNDISDPLEVDEDFFLESIAGLIIPALLFSKSGPANLDFQTVRLKPLSPPPQPL